MQEVLKTLQPLPDEEEARRRREALRALRGIGATSGPSSDEDAIERRGEALRDLDGLLAHVQPTPTDEDVRRILDEERMRKYG